MDIDEAVRKIQREAIQKLVETLPPQMPVEEVAEITAHAIASTYGCTIKKSRKKPK